MNREVPPASSHDARVLRAWASGRLGARGRGEPEVIFGQVREDATVEVAALQTVVRAGIDRPNLLCVGSGGCTGFGLLTVADPARLVLADINPAQIHLLQLKAAAIQQLDWPSIYDAITRDARFAWSMTRDSLPGATRVFWGNRLASLNRGLNQCGAIDRRMAGVMRLFHALFQPRAATLALLTAPNLDAQRAIYQTRWNHPLIRLVLRVGLSRPALRLVYGPEFVRLIPPNLGDIVPRGLERVFQDLPARTNPYLWQAFAARYPEDDYEHDALPPYLTPVGLRKVSARLAQTEFVASDMATVLEGYAPGSLHFAALSNILEGMTETYGRRLFAALHRAAHPKAAAVLRFLLPPPPGWESWLGPNLQVDATLSADLEARDRGLFCRFIRAIRPVGGTTM